MRRCVSPGVGPSPSALAWGGQLDAHSVYVALPVAVANLSRCTFDEPRNHIAIIVEELL